jgi:DNA-directed RNA polymerase specialized sigma24 family protein
MGNYQSTSTNVISDCYKVVQDIAGNTQIFSKNTTMKEITMTELQSKFNYFEGFLKKDSALGIEDVFQEAVLIILQKKSENKDGIKNDKDYFFTVFANTATRCGKKNKAIIKEEIDKVNITLEAGDIVKPIPIKDILFMEPALKSGGEYRLKIKEIATFYSHEIYNWEIKEISKELDLNENTTKSFNFRARQMIRNYLERYFDDNKFEDFLLKVKN